MPLTADRPTMTDVPALLATHAAAVAAYLSTLLDHQAGAPAKLVEAVRYSIDAGGKRLRPALVLETCSAVATDTAEDVGHSAMAAAAAIELIHTFSLVHDDLPAMDDDDLRRGRPTNHKVFGEAMAVLAGDAMTTLAFVALARTVPADRLGAMVLELADATGPRGMIGGQVLDMQGEHQTLDLAGLQAIHRKKTGALLTASCRLGAIAANADERVLAAVTGFGDHLGIAFQIIDDMLDETSTPEQLGKATGKDAGRGKNTYPRLLGLAGSRRAADEHIDAAVAALAPLGDRAERLAAMARFVCDRRH